MNSLPKYLIQKIAAESGNLINIRLSCKTLCAAVLPAFVFKYGYKLILNKKFAARYFNIDKKIIYYLRHFNRIGLLIRRNKSPNYYINLSINNIIKIIKCAIVHNIYPVIIAIGSKIIDLISFDDFIKTDNLLITQLTDLIKLFNKKYRATETYKAFSKYIVKSVAKYFCGFNLQYVMMYPYSYFNDTSKLPLLLAENNLIPAALIKLLFNYVNKNIAECNSLIKYVETFKKPVYSLYNLCLLFAEEINKPIYKFTHYRIVFKYIIAAMYSNILNYEFIIDKLLSYCWQYKRFKNFKYTLKRAAKLTNKKYKPIYFIPFMTAKHTVKDRVKIKIILENYNIYRTTNFL